MNNNTKHRLAHLSPGQTRTFSVPHKVQGNHGPEYSTRSQTITKLEQPRKSRRAKVGAAK